MALEPWWGGRLRSGSTALLAGMREAGGSLPFLRRIMGGAEHSPQTAIRQGLIAALMIMVGSWGVGWLTTSQLSLFARSRFLVPLRVETYGVITCTLLLALGSMLLCRAWLRLRQRTEPWGEHALAPMRKAVLVWSAPLLFTFPILSRDVYSYFAQGRLMHAGLSPYEHWISQLPGWFAQGSDGLWAESSSPYGPLFLMFSRAVYFISGGVPEIGVIMFRALAVAGVLLCLYTVPRLARQLGSEPSWALWITVANPLFLLNMVAGVHNDALMIGGILLSFWLIYAKHRFWGVLAAAVAIGIKPIVVLALPFLGLAMVAKDATLRTKIRAWVYTGVLTAAAMTLFGWASGLGFGWIQAMAGAGSAAFPYAPVGLLGLGVGWVAQLFGGDLSLTSEIVYALFKVLSLGLTFWLAVKKPSGSPVLYTAYSLTAAVILAPIIQPWYVLWLVPLYATARVYSVRWERFYYALTMLLVLSGVVDQLSVGQWFSLAAARWIAAGAGLAYIGYIIFIDPKTATLFGAQRRRPMIRNEATES